MMMFGGGIPRLGPALGRLRLAIERDFVRQPPEWRTHGLSVEVAGFIRKRSRTLDRARPFMRRYQHAGTHQSRLRQFNSPRYWSWFREILVGSIGVAGSSAKDAALSALGSASNRNEDDCERILVECIRQVAQASDIVGADCMSILLSRWGDVRVRFLPDPATDAGHAAYRPWIIAPRFAFAPMELRGRLPHVVAGPFRVEFDRSPPLQPSWPLAASSQPRPPFP
jgi:hypothetical protein